MGIILKNNGEAVVEEKNTTPAVQQAPAADAGNSESTGQNTKAASTQSSTSAVEVPEKAATGLDYATIQQGLNTMYEGKYDAQLADLYNQIIQRKPFEYNTEDDMLFKMYEQKYTQQGKQAMRDTMGQAAALTGGYGSSYGQAVGQQQYDAYLQNLTDLIPQLQDAAYQRYAAEGDRLAQEYGLLSDLDNRDFNRWQTQQGMYNDAYTRLMNEAALKGAAGDFSAYKNMFGEDAANRMTQLFNAQTLMPLYQAGAMDAEMYKALTGAYPAGFVSSNGGDGLWYGGNPTEGDPLTAEEAVRQAHEAYAVGDITQEQLNELIDEAWGRSTE